MHEGGLNLLHPNIDHEKKSLMVGTLPMRAGMSRGFWCGSWIDATKAYFGVGSDSRCIPFVASLRRVRTKRNFLEHLADMNQGAT